MGKAKGSAIEGVVRFLGARREQAESLLPIALLRYLDGSVSAGDWYPEEDLLGLLRTAIRLVPGGRDDVLEEMGRSAVGSHMEKTYAHLIEGGGPDNLNLRAFSLWKAMHDTGEMYLLDQSVGSMRLQLSGFALPSEELCAIIRGYVLGVLEANGIEAEARTVACAARGDDACVWDFLWKPGSCPRPNRS
jgi:hypothetical protein